jgi:Txe/YoeB family toxin of Txe-Axe toxin-antitoxin module
VNQVNNKKKMEKKINEILDAINQNTLFIDSENKIEPFHIYFKLKNYYKGVLTTEDSLNMYIHHLKLENCLSLLRQRNFEGAKGVLVEIEKLNRKFPDFVQNGMDALYFAMLSYNDYVVNQNLEDTLLKEKIAIERGIVQSTYYGYFSVYIPTQWVNILRVLIKYKKEREIIREATLLLKFTLYGIHEDESLCKAYGGVGELEHNLFLKEVLDNLVLNLERSFGYEGMRAMMNNIISIVLSGYYNKPSYNHSIIQVFELIQKYDIGRIEDFIEGIHNNIHTLRDIPDSLKKILTDSFKVVIQETNMKETHLHEAITF